MKRSIAAGFAAAVLAALGFAGAAHATVVPPVAVPACTMPAGWYANADEQTRLPIPTPDGLKFSGNQLIHHATDLTVEHLSPGSFHAFPQPDQVSFMSVEVGEPITYAGYATLRFNTTTHVWDMVTGGQIYSNASPAALVDMPAVHKSHHVFSFGVGYTANPPGTVATTVSSVSFERKTYDLRCHPVLPSHSAPSRTWPSHPKPTHSRSASPCPTHSASPSASTSASASTSPSPSASTSAVAVVTTTTGGTIAGAGVTTTPVADTGALAVTGSNTVVIAAAAFALVIAGGVLFVVTRRRKARFTA